MSHFIRALWIGAFWFASLPACGDPAGDTTMIGDRVVWDDCGFEHPGDAEAGEDKFRFAKYTGQRSGADAKPCYGVTTTHDCYKLPYTKTFTWHWGQSMAQYLGLLTDEDLEALSGFMYAMQEWSDTSGTGFTFTETAGPTGLQNDITIEWSWNPTSDWFGSAGCNVLDHYVTTNAPGQVAYLALFDNCHMDLNVPKMAATVAAWYGIPGYDITPWDVGAAVFGHEFGHIMGLAHAVSGVMKAKMTGETMDVPIHPDPTYWALGEYNPASAGGVTLVTVPGFTPHISQ